MSERRTDRFDLRALLETSRLLSSSLEIDFVLDNLLLTAMSKLFVTRGVVVLDDPLVGAHRVESVKGIRSLARGEHVRLEPVPETVVKGEAVPEALREKGIALMLPIAYHERQIGLIGLGPKATGGELTGDEVAFIDSLVNMSATAVHNARMVEELKEANDDLGRKVQQLNTLFDLSQEFNRTLDADHSVKMLSFALMGQLLVGRYVFLLRSEDGKMELVATRKADTLDSEAVKQLAAASRLVLLDEDAPPEWSGLRDQGFALVLPLRMREETRGVLLLGPKRTGQPYEADDLEFLTSLGLLALTSVENAHGVAARIGKERLEEELRLAREIQERLLPQELPSLEGLEVAALALPSLFVAGDYLDAIRLDDDRLLFAVGDVSGKGMPASLLMANLQACLHVLRGSLTAETLDLAEATGRINTVIHHNTGLTKFITFFWGIYDRRDGRVRYVNAGHNPPLHIHKSGLVETLDEGGVLLGILDGAPYMQGETALAAGDTLLLFTDGVTEAWSALDPDDEYGEARLTETIRTHRTEGAQAILDAVRADVRAFTHDGPLDDDLTLLVLKRDG